MLHLTNPCDKLKVLSLTKPKGKIHKTKSLRHYITVKNEPIFEWEGAFVLLYKTPHIA